MRNRFKSVLAFILTATLLASCTNQPDVTETTELTETELIEEIADIAQEEPEEGEELYMMTGYPVENPGNNDMCDHRLLKEGYVAIVAHNLYNQDHQESERLRSLQVEDLHKK